MTHRLRSYLCGRWQPGTDPQGIPLVNPTTEEPLAQASSAGLDVAAALQFARTQGGAGLRELTFAQRAALLARMAEALHTHREELLDLAVTNGGNTRSDAKFDVDGAAQTLGYYAKLGESLGEKRLLRDAEPIRLGRSPRLVGTHIQTPRHGVAVQINAFNFPAWGFAEKAAPALLAGMPVLCKPATCTALLAARIAEILVEGHVLPDGAVSFLFGNAGDLLTHLGSQDVLAFTGSSDTARQLRGHQAVIARSVRVNVEADSLNAAVLGPDVDVTDDTFELFAAEVTRDVTQKAGQKCTAIRRVFVPAPALAQVREVLAARLGGVQHGDPHLREVNMGPLATADQRTLFAAECSRLLASTALVVGGGRGQPLGIQDSRGYFVAPTLLEAPDADAEAPHAREVFGPLAILIPYDGSALQASVLLRRGGGSLVSSVYSDDDAFVGAIIGQAAHTVGRLHLGSSKIAEHSPGPGTALPMLHHGGPGRAGDGAELGGLRALNLYLQTTAVQGYAPFLEKLA